MMAMVNVLSKPSNLHMERIMIITEAEMINCAKIQTSLCSKKYLDLPLNLSIPIAIGLLICSNI